MNKKIAGYRCDKCHNFFRVTPNQKLYSDRKDNESFKLFCSKECYDLQKSAAFVCRIKPRKKRAKFSPYKPIAFREHKTSTVKITADVILWAQGSYTVNKNTVSI